MPHSFAARAVACALLSLCALARPAGAATTTVPAGGDLQAALDAAQPGDVILLEAGATYVGSYRLPNKPGDRYITLRTADDSRLPPANTRISPQHAAFLAKLQPPSQTEPALVTAEGAHHWRIELLEIAGIGGSDLVVLGGSTSQTQISQMPHDLVLDRLYVHGDPVAGQKRGVAANSGTTYITNSYISDIKAVGMDTQAICGWNGTGPFVIENNYLEAAGENVMFGGADPSIWNLVPSDITVRANLLSKPLAWRQEKWSVKNAFELKNARRVLIEGNIMEHVWAHSQTGIAVLLTTRNQDGKAPWSVVEDVTIRRNVIRHAGGAFSISGYDDLRPSDQGRRILISGNLVHDIDGARWGGAGRFLQIGNQPREVTIESNTILHTGNLITAYGKPIEAFVFRNNLARHNAYGVVGDGQGIGTAALTAYFPGAVFEGNVLAGGNPANYPAQNYFPTLPEFEAGFVDPGAENFALVAGSTFSGGAAGGGSVGADMTALSTGTAGSVAPALPANDGGRSWWPKIGLGGTRPD